MKRKGCILLLVLLCTLVMTVVCEATDDEVALAKERTKKRTGLQTEWTGPTEGPKAAVGKKVVYVNADAQNTGETLWGESFKEASERIGWDVTVLDGKGSVQGQITAITQGISMKADAIGTSANAEPLQEIIKEASDAGILFVGIHASNVLGPDPERNLAYNVTSSGTEIGKALADYVIADSDGKGRAIILYDAQYAIAREKAEAMEAQLKLCKDCELLEVVNSPLSDVPTNMPQLASSWVSKYGKEPFYVMAIADYYFDFVTPTLRAGGIDPAKVKLLGSDGQASAYNRIRNGDYQIVTIPEPTMLGYMAVDALNRLFNGEEPVIFQPPVYVVDASNVDAEGGDQGLFIPSNNFAEIYAKIWGVK